MSTAKERYQNERAAEMEANLEETRRIAGSAQPASLEPLHKLLDYADDSDGSQYGTLSTSLVRDLVNEAIAGITAQVHPAGAVLPAPDAPPIDMVLHCPKCGMQHIDAPDWHNDPLIGAKRVANDQQGIDATSDGEAQQSVNESVPVLLRQGSLASCGHAEQSLQEMRLPAAPLSEGDKDVHVLRSRNGRVAVLHGHQDRQSAPSMQGVPQDGDGRMESCESESGESWGEAPIQGGSCQTSLRPDCGGVRDEACGLRESVRDMRQDGAAEASARGSVAGSLPQDRQDQGRTLLPVQHDAGLCERRHESAAQRDQVPIETPLRAPDHRSHLCRPEDGGCGHIWRPADVPTNGVAAVKTKGQNDSPIAAPDTPVSGLESVPQDDEQERRVMVPLRMTQQMADVVDSEGWQWEDLLAAAEAITEEQHSHLAAAPKAQPTTPDDWTSCLFVGPAPTSYESWDAFIEAPVKRGVEIRAVPGADEEALVKRAREFAASQAQAPQVQPSQALPPAVQAWRSAEQTRIAAVNGYNEALAAAAKTFDFGAVDLAPKYRRMIDTANEAHRLSQAMYDALTALAAEPAAPQPAQELVAPKPLEMVPRSICDDFMSFVEAEDLCGGVFAAGGLAEADLQSIPQQPAAPQATSPLGAPAAPSGSTLQPPSAASAAIPGAEGER